MPLLTLADVRSVNRALVSLVALAHTVEGHRRDQSRTDEPYKRRHVWQPRVGLVGDLDRQRVHERSWYPEHAHIVPSDSDTSVSHAVRRLAETEIPASPQSSVKRSAVSSKNLGRVARLATAAFAGG